jgi:hypothetical protein
MKAIIQHNFTTGIGDFICDLSESMHVAQELKKLGYEIHLRLNLLRNKYSKEPILCKILSEETLNFFSTIEEFTNPITDLEVENTTFWFAAHDPQKPGTHRWDIFIDEIPQNISRIKFDANTASVGIVPQIIPQFSTPVLDKVEAFTKELTKGYSFVQIRIVDSELNNSRLDVLYDKVIAHIDNLDTQVHIGTNNKYLYNRFIKCERVVTYNFTTVDKLGNDLNAIEYYTGEDVFLERLYDNIAEMASIVSCDKIYYYSDHNWVSNFLYYALCMNPKIELINLKQSLH